MGRHRETVARVVLVYGLVVSEAVIAEILPAPLLAPPPGAVACALYSPVWLEA